MALLIVSGRSRGQKSSARTSCTTRTGDRGGITRRERLRLIAVTRFLLEGTGMPIQDPQRHPARRVRTLSR